MLLIEGYSRRIVLSQRLEAVYTCRKADLDTMQDRIVNGGEEQCARSEGFVMCAGSQGRQAGAHGSRRRPNSNSRFGRSGNAFGKGLMIVT